MQRSAGPFEHGRVGDVEAEARGGEELAGLKGLLLALLRQGNIAPPLFWLL